MAAIDLPSMVWALGLRRGWAGTSDTVGYPACLAAASWLPAGCSSAWLGPCFTEAPPELPLLCCAAAATRCASSCAARAWSVCSCMAAGLAVHAIPHAVHSLARGHAFSMHGQCCLRSLPEPCSSLPAGAVLHGAV